MTPVAPAPGREGLRAVREELPAGPISVVALGACALSMLAATLAIRLHAAGYSARAIGINAASAGMAALVIGPFIPSLSARFGTVRLLAAALAIAAASLAGFALTRSFAAWTALRALEGGCATVMFVLGEHWISVRVADRWRGLVVGVYVAGVGAAFALGPLIAAALGALGNKPILAGVALFGAAGLVLRSVARSAPVIERRRRSSLPRLIGEAPVLMLAAGLHGAVETAGLNLLPVETMAVAGPAGAALFTSLFIGGAGLLQLPIGIFAGRIGRTRMLAALAALASLGALALAAIGAERPLPFAIALVLWGGVTGSFYPVGLAELPRRFARESLVGANSAFVLAYAAGTLIGPPLVGEAVDHLRSGFFLMLALLTALYLAAAVPAVWRTRDRASSA